MEIEKIVSRGIKRKYDFDVQVGEIRKYSGTTSAIVINCAKSFCYRRDLDWEYHCFTVDGIVNVVRIK